MRCDGSAPPTTYGIEVNATALVRDLVGAAQATLGLGAFPSGGWLTGRSLPRGEEVFFLVRTQREGSLAVPDADSTSASCPLVLYLPAVPRECEAEVDSFSAAAEASSIWRDPSRGMVRIVVLHFLSEEDVDDPEGRRKTEGVPPSHSAPAVCAQRPRWGEDRPRRQVGIPTVLNVCATVARGGKKAEAAVRRAVLASMRPLLLPGQPEGEGDGEPLMRTLTRCNPDGSLILERARRSNSRPGHLGPGGATLYAEFCTPREVPPGFAGDRVVYLGAYWRPAVLQR